MFLVLFWGAAWLATVLLLLWPALLNGGAIWFFDTIAYLNAAEKAVSVLLGIDTGLLQASGGAGMDPPVAREAAALAQSLPVPDLSAQIPAVQTPAAGIPAGPGAEAAGQAMAEKTIAESTIQAGRSVYYGLPLLASLALLGPYGPALMQAALFALALLAALAAWLPGRPQAAALIALATAGLTGAPFFAGYMMPDFLSGLAVIAILRLLLGPPGGWGESLGWAALLGFALVAHTSHLVLAAGLLVASLAVLPLCRVPFAWRGMALTVLALLGALAAEMAFVMTVERVYGTPPQRLPFLSARLIEDGTGYDHLVRTCPDTPPEPPAALPYELCRYLDRLPVGSLEFLWSRDPQIGVYQLAPPASRQRIAAEQFGFALATVSAAPLRQAGISARLMWEQLQRVGLGEFPYPDRLREHLARSLAPGPAAAVAQTRFHRGGFPIAAADMVVRAVAVASILAVPFLLFLPGGTGPADETRRMRALTAMILLALLGNAAITGALSAPFDRYQARIVWLLTLLAGLLLATRRFGLPAPLLERRT